MIGSKISEINQQNSTCWLNFFLLGGGDEQMASASAMRGKELPKLNGAEKSKQASRMAE